MTLHTLLVATKKITSNVPATNFDPQVINQLAELIIQAGGLINPLVVKRTSLTSFEVVSGHLEYHAAVRAREINLRLAEMINCYVLEGVSCIDQEKDNALLEQVNLIRKTTTQTQLNNDPTPITDRSIELAKAIASLPATKRAEMMKELPLKAIELINQYI